MDVYDFAPAFQKAGATPAVTSASLRDMARLGVRTLYLQAAQDDRRSEGDVVSRALVGEFLVRAHRAGLRVVAWYLPHFADVDADLRRVVALRDFRAKGERFDGIALDIEWTDDVPNAAVRNARLVSLSDRLRDATRGVPLGAIVYPPVLLEDVNPKLWPDFPWKRLAPRYDVWLPMAYWTLRSPSSPLHDAGTYTTETVRRLRADLGADDAPVHVIGGIADASTADDDAAFVRAARAAHAVGWSTYDFDTTHSDAWPRLRAGS